LLTQPFGCFFPWKEVKKMLKLFVSLQNRFAELRDREEGQAYVEYGVLIAVVALGMIVALGLFKTQLGNAFSAVGTKLINSVP
jgi:Flp pilus assembly pilin Flp